MDVGSAALASRSCFAPPSSSAGRGLGLVCTVSGVAAGSALALLGTQLLVEGAFGVSALFSAIGGALGSTFTLLGAALGGGLIASSVLVGVFSFSAVLLVFLGAQCFFGPDREPRLADPGELNRSQDGGEILVGEALASTALLKADLLGFLRGNNFQNLQSLIVYTGSFSTLSGKGLGERRRRSPEENQLVLLLGRVFSSVPPPSEDNESLHQRIEELGCAFAGSRLAGTVRLGEVYGDVLRLVGAAHNVSILRTSREARRELLDVARTLDPGLSHYLERLVLACARFEGGRAEDTTPFCTTPFWMAGRLLFVALRSGVIEIPAQRNWWDPRYFPGKMWADRDISYDRKLSLLGVYADCVGTQSVELNNGSARVGASLSDLLVPVAESAGGLHENKPS